MLIDKLYIEYDSEKDFHEQLIKRKEELNKIREQIIEQIK